QDPAVGAHQGDPRPGGCAFPARWQAGRQGVLRRAVRRILMFVDASVLVAVITGEPDATHLETRLVTAERSYASAVVTYEATLGIARSLNISVGNAESLVDD